MRRLGADPREPEPLSHRRDHRHGSIGGDGHHPGHAVALARCGDRVEVEDVGHFGDVGLGQAGSVGVPVDGDDTRAQLAHLSDRTPLVPARADEEDASHSLAMLTRRLRLPVEEGKPAAYGG